MFPYISTSSIYTLKYSLKSPMQENIPNTCHIAKILVIERGVISVTAVTYLSEFITQLNNFIFKLTLLINNRFLIVCHATGLAGTPGQKGERGSTGLVGPDGPPGKTGERGLQGQVGQPGPVGESGARGERGSQGITGEAGTPGSPGERGPIGPQVCIFSGYKNRLTLHIDYY